MTGAKGLIFLHIPKTAGTTLRTIIHRQYPSRVIYYISNPDDIARFLALPDETRRALRVVQGHVPYGFHQHLALPVDYITVLRNPVELVASLYYFILKKRFPGLIDWADGKSLDEFASSVPRVRNLQTRYVSGLIEEGVPGALETAAQNLSRNIAVFGLDTRFDESLILFKRRLDWSNVFYHPLNINKGRPLNNAIPRSTVALIERHNALDMELYEFATRSFDDTLARQEAAYWDELRAFRRLNPVCGRLNEAYRRARHDMPRRVRAFIKNRRKALGGAEKR